MHTEHTPTQTRVPTTRAVRHHMAVVIVFLALGALGGWLYAASVPQTYTSTARVLVNPSVGNPYAPTPASVRQDEATSLETEAQVARSAEVLGTVADPDSGLTTAALARRVQVTVPPNTQILEISYTASHPEEARTVTDAVAAAYLENRARRFEEVNAARIERVETRTLSVVTDLRAATKAAQLGSAAKRSFESQLADALRNELVSLRAQRTALENSESPPGEVISAASAPRSAENLTAILLPVGGAVAGLALGCLLAALLERFAGAVRTTAEVEAAGLPVVAAIPRDGRRVQLLRRGDAEAFGTTIRRLRAKVLDLEPRPNVIAVAPTGTGRSNADVAEAVAESLAKAGHRVVLVRTHGQPTKGGLRIEEQGLAQALLYERLNVMDLLQPTVEPLLSLLPDGGFTAQSRELILADRLRAVLSPLVEAGQFVVIQSPGIDSAEGEAFIGAADLGLVVVTIGRTRPNEVEQVTNQVRTRGARLEALVIGPRGSARGARRAIDDIDSDVKQEEAVTHDAMTRTTR